MKKQYFNRGGEFLPECDLDAMNGFGFDKYSDAIGAPARFSDMDACRTTQFVRTAFMRILHAASTI